MGHDFDLETLAADVGSGGLRSIGEALAETMHGQSPDVTLRPDGGESTDAQRAVEALAELGSAGRQGPAGLRLGETIGTGGMGVVHAARQETLGRTVAVKTLRDASATEGNRQAFLREAWVTGRLEHPNVVPMYDLRLDEQGRPLLVMRRIQGASWLSALDSPEILETHAGDEDPLEWHLRVLVQVCHALEYAHRHGILHRDVKPENVVVGDYGEVYLIDWGIAAALHDDGTGQLPLLANERGIAGTPSYMAPEMLLAQPDQQGPRTDVYLVGATLHHVLTGQPPHRGQDARAILEACLLGAVAYPPHTPAGLIAVCERAMQRAPEERYPDVAALRRDVEAWLRQRSSLRLLDDATHHLDELRRLCAADAIEPQVHRGALFRALGACRFGFGHALSVWPENRRAREALQGAITLVASWELDHGDTATAEALALELPYADSTLAARVATARRAEATERARVERLASVGADADPARGGASRVRFMVWSAILFGCAAPLLELAAALSGWVPPSHGANIGRSIGVLAGVLVFVRLGSGSLPDTRTNRGVLRALVTLAAALLPISLLGPLLGMAPNQVQALYLVVWGFVLLVAFDAYDRRMIPTGLLYLGGGFAAALWPDAVLAIVALTNGAFILAMHRTMGRGPRGARPSTAPGP